MTFVAERNRRNVLRMLLSVAVILLLAPGAHAIEGHCVMYCDTPSASSSSSSSSSSSGMSYADAFPEDLPVSKPQLRGVFDDIQARLHKLEMGDQHYLFQVFHHGKVVYKARFAVGASLDTGQIGNGINVRIEQEHP